MSIFNEKTMTMTMKKTPRGKEYESPPLRVSPLQISAAFWKASKHLGLSVTCRSALSKRRGTNCKQRGNLSIAFRVVAQNQAGASLCKVICLKLAGLQDVRKRAVIL